jgi:phytoene synthase
MAQAAEIDTTAPGRSGRGASDGTLRAIFRNGSKTYFNSSRFFPKAIRDDVFVLYAFVRTADDYVDAIPQRREDYFRFKENHARAMRGESTGDLVNDAFAELARRHGFQQGWLQAFFESMEMDLNGDAYETIDAVERYIYGSAEVVGLMMCRVLGLRPEAYPYARKLGAGMQYINFIRDIAEDAELGRIYFPEAELRGYGLPDLREETTRAHPDSFRALVVNQIDRYLGWQEEGQRGYRYIPLRYRVAIDTASRMYRWTALQIRKDPFVVYERKVKPSKGRILAMAVAVLAVASVRGTVARLLPKVSSEESTPACRPEGA